MIIKGSRFNARRLSLHEIDRFQFPQVPLYHLQGIKIPAKEKTMNQGKTTKMIFYFYHKNYMIKIGLKKILLKLIQLKI